MSRLHRILHRIRTRWMFWQANRAWQALRNDPSAWAEEENERRLWEATLMDGLLDAPP